MISDSCNYIYRWTVGAVRGWIMLEQHGRDNLYRVKGVRGWAYTVTKKVSEKIKKSKDGKQNIRDSGVANLSDKEVSRRARDKSLSPKERQRYKKEEKARELRNKQKRKSHY